MLDRPGETLGKDRVGKYQTGQEPNQEPADEFAHVLISLGASNHAQTFFHQFDPGKRAKL
jgi:hypothetical protein